MTFFLLNQQCLTFGMQTNCLLVHQKLWFEPFAGFYSASPIELQVSEVSLNLGLINASSLLKTSFWSFPSLQKLRVFSFRRH